MKNERLVIISTNFYLLSSHETTIAPPFVPAPPSTPLPVPLFSPPHTTPLHLFLFLSRSPHHFQPDTLRYIQPKCSFSFYFALVQNFPSLSFSRPYSPTHHSLSFFPFYFISIFVDTGQIHKYYTPPKRSFSFFCFAFCC